MMYDLAGLLNWVSENIHLVPIDEIKRYRQELFKKI